MLDLSIESLFVKMTFLSPGRVFRDQGSFESCFFCMVGGSRKDSYHGKS
jgi:hypothetical protein